MLLVTYYYRPHTVQESDESLNIPTVISIVHRGKPYHEVSTQTSGKQRSGDLPFADLLQASAYEYDLGGLSVP